MFKTISPYIFITILIALNIILSPNTVKSQEVAIGTATATVLSAITITATDALAIGNVYQGVPEVAANNDSRAAVFDISGQSGAGVTMYMILPEYLSLSDGTDRMTISFSTTDVSIDTTGASDPTGMMGSKGWQNTNPYNFPSGTLIGSSGTSVYLGGKVYPSPYQRAGSYSGDIILTVSYNGT
ncbi:MAG: DUF4402 domain-containing protein [candidate division Zixibacteria bacterium]|nr:DUF4402 domain-containing protein [candidate division Zixibacteria bacterium]